MDSMALGILQQFFPRCQIPLAPWRNNLDLRRQCIGRELEADLIISLARCSMRNRVGTRLLCRFDEVLCNQGPCYGRTEHVFAFVQRIRAQHGKYEIRDKFFA